jgi:hypothetical protein
MARLCRTLGSHTLDRAGGAPFYANHPSYRLPQSTLCTLRQCMMTVGVGIVGFLFGGVSVVTTRHLVAHERRELAAEWGFRHRD